MKLFDLIKLVFGSFDSTVPAQKPVVTAGLKRVDSNVKVTWVPNTDILSQRIVVIAHGQEIINKYLPPETHTFSFEVAKKSTIVLSLYSTNTVGESDPATLEFLA